MKRSHSQPVVLASLIVLSMLPGHVVAAMATGQVSAPADVPYPGEITVSVDADDLSRKIIHVHEQITGLRADTVLWYPKWYPGVHAPVGPIDKLAGLRMTGDGTELRWTRDPVNVYEFHIRVPTGAHSVVVDFDYLSPTSARVGKPDISPELLILDWNQVILYPGGYYARRIPVTATLSVPQGWTFATALEPADHEGARTTFRQVSLEKLVDSPVIAGHYSSRIELDAATHVHLDVFADRPDLLQASPDVIERHRALVSQAYKLFASHHYDHYDFLFGLSEEISGRGLEHHESSEDVGNFKYFLDWDGTPSGRDLLAHEFTHSWNGKFRRPADLWTPNYEVPMQDSLLWVYEGQTEYWGYVLTARSGLWSKAQALDALAEIAADYSSLPGRRWRSLEDTTNDPIINPRRPMSWKTWQRSEDYYDESALIWLEADTLIRERSQGQRSLDDFAKRFFGVDNGRIATETYTFADVVAALNAVETYDWASFLRQRLDATNAPTPLGGVTHGGYELVYTDTPSDFLKTEEAERKEVLLRYSIGIDIDDKDGTLKSVVWGSPAFKAGITEGMQILAVNGVAYTGDLLKRTITAAQKSSEPIELILKNADRYVVARVEYSGGLRYPHLERIRSAPALLDDILAPRP